MYRFFLAVRYLLSRPINLLGMFGVMLGVWALIVVVSIFSGFLRVASEHVKSAGSDITVFYLQDGTTYDKLKEAVEADPNVAATSPRLVHYGILHPTGSGRRPKRASFGELLPGGGGPYLAVLGVDPQLVQQTTGMRSWLDSVDEAELRVLDPDDPLAPVGELPAILLGRDRMLSEGLRRGDTVVLTTGKPVSNEGNSTRTFRPEDQEFVVAGAYATRHMGFDEFNTFVHIDTMRAILAPNQGSVVNEISVRVHDLETIEETAQRLQRAVQLELGLQANPRRVPFAFSWRKRNGPLLESVEHQRSLMKIVLFVIMVVAAFLMYATLSMMVSEKTHDIGILTAMGGTPLGVMQVFLACGLTITGAGTVLGIVAGCTSSVYLDDFNKFMRSTFDVDLFPTRVYNIDHVPYELDPLWIAQVTIMALVVGTVVSALPAFRAARHDPLVSLRNE